MTETERAVLEAVQAEEREDWLEAAAAWIRAARTETETAPDDRC